MKICFGVKNIQSAVYNGKLTLTVLVEWAKNGISNKLNEPKMKWAENGMSLKSNEQSLEWARDEMSRI